MPPQGKILAEKYSFNPWRFDEPGRKGSYYDRYSSIIRRVEGFFDPCVLAENDPVRYPCNRSVEGLFPQGVAAVISGEARRTFARTAL